ncbi:MAG: hypothetical protein KBS55_00305 [Bacteroidales bacterium]|nr:hypothetical protein [Candidatus Cryptobacteroides aphodequi]
MNHSRIALLLGAAVLMAACNNAAPLYRIKISAAAENPTGTPAKPAAVKNATKTVLEEDLSVSFTSSDRIAVFSENGLANPFTVSTLYEDGSADFSGTVDYEDDSYIAMYPYQTGSSALVSTGEVLVKIPAVQTAVAGSFDPEAGISIGRTVNTNGNIHSLELKNVCALLKFSVPVGESYSVAELITGDDVYLSGDLVFLANEDPVNTYVVDFESSDVQLCGTIEGGNWYYIAINPVTFEHGFALHLYEKESDVESGRYATVKSTNASVSLKRSEILNLGIIGTDAGAGFEPVAGETIFEW